ncbi:MAG: hypothetical protein WD554_03415 [Flavobacteriaceae bacterium]
MKHFSLLILLLFLSNFSFSQNYIIVDAETKKPLPFVAVHNDDNGFYAGEHGDFKLPSDIKDSIKLQHLGYQTISLSTNDLGKIKDTVFMIPNVQSLNEVIITNKKEKREFIKPLKRGMMSWPLSSKHELLVLIQPNTKYINAYIEKIHLPILSKHHWLENAEKSYKDAYAFLRVNIYRQENKLPVKSIYSSQPIKISGFSKDEIIVNLADALIQLDQKGLFFGIELIGYFNNGEIIESTDAFVRPRFTKKISKHFNAETFIKLNFFQGEDDLIPYKSIIERGGMINPNINLNLAIGFTLIPQETKQ